MLYVQGVGRSLRAHGRRNPALSLLGLPDTRPAVQLDRVCRSYDNGSETVWALSEICLDVAEGEVVAITGPSGSGKTTLVNLVAGLDRPTSGNVTVFGQRLNGLSESALSAFRARSVGIVFQDPHLLPGLTALENVVVARLPWQPRRALEAEARKVLAAVGLEKRMDFPPSRLSGGERQRVGIARALLGRPPLLLADEPTGNLDAATTENLVALLDELRLHFQVTLILATHDPAVAAMANRLVRLIGGRVEADRALDRRADLDVHTLE
jgi:putative ABC transport system ATP-binding protein